MICAEQYIWEHENPMDSHGKKDIRLVIYQENFNIIHVLTENINVYWMFINFVVYSVRYSIVGPT